VCVPYGILAGEPDYLDALAEQIKKDAAPSRRAVATSADVEQLRNRISAMWPAIAEATGARLDELAERRERIVRRVRLIKQAIREKDGFNRRIAQERLAHPVVRGLDLAAKVHAEIALAPFTWVRVTDGTTRWYAPEPPMAHVLGRLAEKDDVFFREASVDPGSGVRGSELLAEARLHGTPGWVQEDIDGREVAPPEPPRDGEDVRLTIDAMLQRRIFERLEKETEQYPLCTGASAVVLDVTSREALALVSFPSYMPDADFKQRRALATERKTLPLAFRAVAMNYPPGSIVKPLVLAAALTDGVVTPETLLHCTGRLLPDVDAFRCAGIHGDISAIDAIAHSCNMYFFRVGEAMGVPRLGRWFELAGFGNPSGTGLAEEIRGQLPIKANPGDARNTAIGQGEVEVTPIQTANMIATIASGEYRAITLLADDPRERRAALLGVPPAHWAVVRRGMHDVVNEPGGTAYGKVQQPPEPWVLLGKTGSAQSWPRELERLYVVEWPDGRREELVAPDDAELERRLAGKGEFKIAGKGAYRRWPPEDQMETHAWFAGYIIDRADLSRLGAAPRRAVAIVILLEYAGHGGDVAGPVAGDIARMVLEVWPERR
jgi:penicillin-binding protein 2